MNKTEDTIIDVKNRKREKREWYHLNILIAIMLAIIVNDKANADTMAYLVDHLRDLPDVDSVRLSFDRRVNINKFGAWYPYYTSQQYWRAQGRLNWNTTNVPAADAYQNAVVFWRVYESEVFDEEIEPVAFGYTISKVSLFPAINPFPIPNRTKVCVVRPDVINAQIDAIPYYFNNESMRLHDFEIIVKSTIAHELGHAIGMEDGYTDTTNTPTIMGKFISDPDSHFRIAVYPPYLIKEYSDTSKSEISIKEKFPWQE